MIPAVQHPARKRHVGHTVVREIGGIRRILDHHVVISVRRVPDERRPVRHVHFYTRILPRGAPRKVFLARLHDPRIELHVIHAFHGAVSQHLRKDVPVAAPDHEHPFRRGVSHQGNVRHHLVVASPVRLRYLHGPVDDQHPTEVRRGVHLQVLEIRIRLEDQVGCEDGLSKSGLPDVLFDRDESTDVASLVDFRISNGSVDGGRRVSHGKHRKGTRAGTPRRDERRYTGGWK
mmetsp:Transcript_40384/g.79004  ORF Transcript_40384/g.79004 Transcript_40384/m.79004 type:complete len:232 (+) Transcript_40384:753-1448(+)